MTFSVEIESPDEVSESGHSVEIYVDQKNLLSLVKRLTLLADNPPGEHLHFMSESWGLGDLTEETHMDSNVITHHLKIIVV